MSEFIRKLTGFMQHQGWNESETARQLGVPASQVHRWVKGDTRPVGINLVKLKRAIKGLADEDVYPVDAPAPASTPAAEDGR